MQDQYALRFIQNKLGGSIKLRSGAKTLRYRLHKLSVIVLIKGILCIKTLFPNILHNKHGLFSGFFDSDGTITLSLKGEYKIPQLTISVIHKLLIDVIYLEDQFIITDLKMDIINGLSKKNDILNIV